MSRQREVVSGTVRLAVRCDGDPAAPPVLLVHGYPDAGQVWDAVAERLAAEFLVIRYDVRGAGQSSAPAEARGYRLEQLSQDLQAVMDAVSPDRPVHLVGHDWGSIQTWEAVTDPALKERIASFTSLSGPCLDHMGYWLRDKLRQPSPAHVLALVRQLIRSWYVMLFHLPGTGLVWKLGLARLWPRLLRMTEGIDAPGRPSQSSDGWNGVALYRANFLRRLLLPRARTAVAPVQLVIAENDAYVSAGIFDGLARWVPELYVKRVRGGHWLPLKRPALVAGLIADFVRAREKPDGTQFRLARVQGPLREFSGRQVLVTGAASGIGRATALAFAEQGASLILADLNLDGAERTALLARLHGVSAWACRVDVGDGVAMRTFADGVEDAFGLPDIIINNAGIGMAGGLLHTSEQDWERILRVNLWGLIHGIRLFGERMVQSGNGGHIVNVASAAAFTPSRTFPAYATTKAAALMLSECARAEFSRFDIGVTAVCPGFVDTGIALSTQYTGVNADEQQRRREQAAKLYQRRGFTPEKVAAAIVQAVRRNRPLALVGVEAQGARWMSRFMPWAARLFARIDFSPN